MWVTWFKWSKSHHYFVFLPWGSSLNLTGTESNSQISNICIFGLSTTMTCHDSPSSLFWLSYSINSFWDWSNLVDLQKKAGAGFFFDSTSNFLRIGDREVISYYLECFSIFLSKFCKNIRNYLGTTYLLFSILMQVKNEEMGKITLYFWENL